MLERDQAAYTAIRALLKAETPDAHGFYTLVEQALKKELYGPQARNAAEHVWGYVDRLASPSEKKRALAGMAELQSGVAALPRVKRLLLALAERHKVEYLLHGIYLYV